MAVQCRRRGAGSRQIAVRSLSPKLHDAGSQIVPSYISGEYVLRLTQAQLADRIGVTQPTIQRWERAV